MLCFATDRFKQKHFIHHNVIVTWPTKFNTGRNIVEKVRTKIKTYHILLTLFLSVSLFAFILYDNAIDLIKYSILFNRL